MTRAPILLYAFLTLTLGACASSPPANYFTLDDGQPATARSSAGLGITITQVTLPELIDRPQLVVRTAGHQVQFSEHYRWAEPLRNQIRRIIAHDLSELLDAQDTLADVKVRIDIQRFEVVAGQRVDLIAAWHVQPGKRPAFLGRASLAEDIAANVPAKDYSAMVAAHRRALRRLATRLAADINNHSGRSVSP